MKCETIVRSHYTHLVAKVPVHMLVNGLLLQYPFTHDIRPRGQN